MGNVVKKPQKLAGEIEHSPFNSGYAVLSPCGTRVKSVFPKLWRRHETGEPHLGVSRRAAPERSLARSQVRMRHRSGAIKLAIVGLCLASLTSTVALADPENGRRLADRWCSACHVVGPGQQRASADVPPFSTIAHAPGFNARRLTFFLLEPHPRMPSMSLSRKEAADIVDYIKQLRDAK
jgi:hypothetical protein